MSASLGRRRLTPADRDAAVLAALERGDGDGRVPSLREMAARLGCSPGTVHASYRRIGIRSTGPIRRDHMVVISFRLDSDVYDALWELSRDTGGVPVSTLCSSMVTTMVRLTRQRVTQIVQQATKGAELSP